MDNLASQEEKNYLERFWKDREIEISDTCRFEINKLVLFSKKKREAESRQVQNAKKQGISLMLIFTDSSKLDNWVKYFLIRYENLSEVEFKDWLIGERSQFLNAAKKAPKHSFYFEILKSIKSILNEKQKTIDKEDLKRVLLELFKKDKISECFHAFENNQLASNELIQIESQWNNLERLKMTGQIGISPTVDENRIKQALLNLINEMT
jgi:hypothetical protein